MGASGCGLTLPIGPQYECNLSPGSWRSNWWLSGAEIGPQRFPGSLRHVPCSAPHTALFYSDTVLLHLLPLPTSCPSIGALLPRSLSTMVVSCCAKLNGFAGCSDWFNRNSSATVFRSCLCLMNVLLVAIAIFVCSTYIVIVHFSALTNKRCLDDRPQCSVIYTHLIVFQSN